MTSKITTLVPALLIGLALTACNNLADRPGAHVTVVHQGELETRDVRDVVIAEVINESTAQEIPVEALRAGFSKALVKRRYSPLALPYVDANTREASAGASLLGEDATLQVVVKEWDRSQWDTQGVLVVEVEAWMLDAGYAGRELWGSRLERRYSLRQEMDVAATEAILLRQVCEQIADDLLEVMPAHTAKP
ncbi:MAG: hypothetical protein KDC14_11580 [Planctomycetes bacterium]|nr:hypothetical protein [Planctomycetota bacterium]